MMSERNSPTSLHVTMYQSSRNSMHRLPRHAIVLVFIHTLLIIIDPVFWSLCLSSQLIGIKERVAALEESNRNKGLQSDRCLQLIDRLKSRVEQQSLALATDKSICLSLHRFLSLFLISVSCFLYYFSLLHVPSSFRSLSVSFSDYPIVREEFNAFANTTGSQLTELTRKTANLDKLQENVTILLQRSKTYEAEVEDLARRLTLFTDKLFVGSSSSSSSSPSSDSSSTASSPSSTIPVATSRELMNVTLRLGLLQTDCQMALETAKKTRADLDQLSTGKLAQLEADINQQKQLHTTLEQQFTGYQNNPTTAEKFASMCVASNSCFVDKSRRRTQ